MMTDRDTDRILRSWFREGVGGLPDRVLDSVVETLPRVRQRRRPWVLPELGGRRGSWLRVAIVATALLALLTGLLLVAGGRLFAPPRPRAFTTGDELLEPGRYVIDAPFPIRLGIDVPPGWRGVEDEPSWILLARDDPDSSAELLFTFVDAVYADPCHYDQGLLGTLGPSADDLALVLSGLRGVDASPVTHPIVGGRRAAAVTLTAPDSFAGCTTGDLGFRLWGLPETYALAESARSRISILDVGANRLVVVATDGGPRSAAEADLDALVGSIDLSVDPVPPEGPRDTASPPDEPLPTLPAAGPVEPGGYAFGVPAYAEDAAGALSRLPGPYDAALEVLPGWFATERGLASGSSGTPAASLGVWTIVRVYLDPCRWQTSELGTANRSMVVNVERLAEALSSWWPPNPDPVLTTGDYVPPPGAPNAARPIRDAWNGKEARRQVLEVPRDVDLDECDGGEYRLWDDPLGRSRTAQPGERIQLWIIDLEPGIVVLDAAFLPTADTARVRELMAMSDSTWIGPALLR